MKNITAKRNHKSSAKLDGALDTALKSSFLGILISAGVGLALLFVGTAAALMTDDPTAFVEPVGYVSIFVTAFIGGFACSKLNKRSPYIVSILCGAGFVILSMLFSLALPHSLASGMKIWIRLALHALSFTLFPVGALVGVKSSRPKRNKIRKRR